MDSDSAKPVLVLDLNWLQQLSAANEHLSNRCRYLVSPRILFEICDRDSARRAGDFGKLIRVWSKNLGSFFMGHLTNTLMEREVRTGKPTEIVDLEGRESTALMRQLVEQGFSEAIRELEFRTIESREIYLDIRERFFLVLVAVAKQQDSETTRYLRDRLPFEYAESMAFAKSGLAWTTYWEIEAVLGPNAPDDSAHQALKAIEARGRPFAFDAAVRLLAYLRAEIVAQRIGTMENDFDDIQYAVNAAITGYLGSRDKRLSRMVTGCSPHVTVFAGRYPSQGVTMAG